MEKDSEKIDLLLNRLEVLLHRQEAFNAELTAVKLELDSLKYFAPSSTQAEEVGPDEAAPVAMVPEPTHPLVDINPDRALSSKDQGKPAPTKKTDFEKFIGENLISKIGIAITVLGVGIGAKYAIDNNMISPLTRVIFGYMMGIGLMAFSLKLKKNYASFSAVLLSGAMAIMYFITYFAYAYYALFPQTMAFGLMVLFTLFTVYAAIQYDQAIIAHIGLVGAYAVPFFLSDGSGKVAILYAYMAVINTGILTVAFKKYWKSLYYASFVLTWLIYSVWFFSSFSVQTHFTLSLIYLVVFFFIFYATFLAYKIGRQEKFNRSDVIMLMINAFLFFGIGYQILDSHEAGTYFLGLFALVNAVIHAGVSLVIYRHQGADKNLFYFVVGLVMVFITLAIPIQLDGSWVTLLWVGQAALLFWIGRTKAVSMYEKLAYPLMLLSFFSILHDWSVNYGGYFPDQPETYIPILWNINFLVSLIVVAGFAFIAYLNHTTAVAPGFTDSKVLYTIIRYIIPILFLIVLYKAFELEVASYWSQKYLASEIKGDINTSNYALLYFKNIWTLNYTMFFLFILSVVNLRWIKSQQLSYLNLGLNVLVLVVFLAQGLLELSSLREIYLGQSPEDYYPRGAFYIWIRYVTFIFAAFLVMSIYAYIRQEFAKPEYKVAFDLLFHATILWVISSELLHWMDILDFNGALKLGLSILWGIYALLLIALGILHRKKHLRIGAIILFATTLGKLFLYDIASLDTISKTVVFVSLGILLLIISFLYNKYKHRISNEVEV